MIKHVMILQIPRKTDIINFFKIVTKNFSFFSVIVSRAYVHDIFFDCVSDIITVARFIIYFAMRHYTIETPYFF